MRLWWAAAILSLGLLAAPALPALADDAERIAACLDSGGAGDPGALFANCVGPVTERCADELGFSTLATTECLSREHEAWDALLNRYWKQLRDSAKADGTWDSLLAAQRAWLAFRDAECAYRYEVFADGTIRTVIGASCMRDLTAQRVIDFRSSGVR